MPGLDRHLAAIPPPVVIVVAALLVHRLPSLPGREVALALLGCGLLATICLPATWHAARMLALAFAAAGLAIVMAQNALSARIEATQEGRDFTVTGRVVSMPMQAERSNGFLFDIEDCVDRVPDCPRARRVRLGWYATARGGLPAEVQPGERWRLTIALKRVHAMHNPGTFDAELRSLQNGIAAQGSVRVRAKATAANPEPEPEPGAGPDPRSIPASPERLEALAWNPAIGFERLRMRIRASMRAALADARPEAVDVVIALVTGDQAGIGTRWWDAFNRTGISHLVAISGLHITMLAGIAVTLARGFLRWPPVAASGLLLRWPARQLAWLFGLFIAFFYAGIAGWGIPAQRTCWMLAVAGISLFTGRTRSMPRILALAAGVVTLFDPWAPLAPGFWLSFASVAAIVWSSWGGRLRVSVEGLPRRRRLYAALAVAGRTQWAATLALVPLGALFFASFSLSGPIANAFAIPLVSLWVTPLAIAAGLLSLWLPLLARPMLLAATWPTGWLLDAISWLSDSRWSIAVVAIPGALALVFCVAAIVVLLAPMRLVCREFALAGLLPLLVAGNGAPPPGVLRIVALDVGQGSAILVEMGGRRLLYDTGPSWGADSDAGARIIVPYLRARGIDRLDAIIVSHPDADHVGGLPALLRSLRIDWLAGTLPADHPLRASPQLARHSFRDCRRGQVWHWGEARLEVLHPGSEPPRAPRSPTNAASCAVRVVTPAATVLLTGDLETGQERELMATLGAEALRADLLFAGHHGSNTSSGAAFLAAVAPSCAIAQAGYRNRFRHPAARVLERYRAAGIGLLRTDRDGAITIEFGPDRHARVWRSRVDDRRYWRVRIDDGRTPPDLPC